jgi:hypothetical protein
MLQPRITAQVDFAPDAAGFSGAKADREGFAIYGMAYAINPAEAKRLVERLRVRNTSAARAGFAETQTNLASGRVVGFQPCAPVRRGAERLWLHTFMT